MMLNELNEIFLRIGLRGMAEGKDYRAVDEVFTFVAEFIDLSMEHEKTKFMTKVHTWYSTSSVFVTGSMAHHAWNEETLETLIKR